MTILGYESLKAELKQLTSKDRPAVINAISTAREHGDLKENAEYHAAKEQQGFIEGRIQELNAKLALANVIDIAKLSGTKVVFGATVSFVDVDTDEESNYQLVGAGLLYAFFVNASMSYIRSRNPSIAPQQTSPPVWNVSLCPVWARA